MHTCNCARRSCNVTRSKSKDPHMSAKVSKPTDAPRLDSAVAGRLFFLDVTSGRIMSVNPTVSPRPRILAAVSCQQVVQLLGAALAVPKRHKP